MFDAYQHLIKKNELLAQYSYMKVGGPADYLAVCTTTDELIGLLRSAHSAQVPVLVMGGGSNIIFSDRGFRGMVVVNRTNNLNIDSETGLVRVSSGYVMNALVNQVDAAGLGGLETFLGVPGTVGGAIYNNSHYLKELVGDYVSQVRLLRCDLSDEWMNHNYFKFDYDYSILHETGEAVLEVEFKLVPHNDPAALLECSKAALARRRQTQPLQLPSSGCMFQNVPSHVPSSAGALIDAAGLKGVRVGGAEISSVHANFIVNTGSATTQDIINLSDMIIDKVKQQYGVTLHREVFIINEYGERVD